MESSAAFDISAAAAAWRKYIEDRCKLGLFWGLPLSIICFSVAADEITKTPMDPLVEQVLKEFHSHSIGSLERLQSINILLDIMMPLVISLSQEEI